MKRRFNHVAVLKGGISSERDVSLKSGEAVARGLRNGGYSVDEIDITSRDLSIPAGIEAVFIALHGAFGEDGEIQQLLKNMGMPFTGSGAASSRTSFDKVLTREVLSGQGIPVPEGEVIRNPEQRTIPLPLVVKPPREGSSVGCHIVTDESAWAAAFSDSAQYSEDVLIEAYIPGREMTVGVVEEGTRPGRSVDRRVLPVVEIIPAGKWYDYDAKYITGETVYSVPAEIDAGTADLLQSIALRTFDALNARGFGRIDFRLSPDNEPYVLELNAIPGFTATSLLPKAAAAAGMGFPDLCCRIMELAALPE